MLLALVRLIRRYTQQATNWLLMSAFAIDTLTMTLLAYAREQCRRWYEVQAIKIRNGRIIKFEVKK